MIDIRKFRKERKLTQVVFGNMLGYTHSYISNIENGKGPITDKFLDKLNEVFQVEVEEFKSYNGENGVTVVEEPAPEYSQLKIEYEALQRKYTRVLEENNELHARLQALMERQASASKSGRKKSK